MILVNIVREYYFFLEDPDDLWNKLWLDLQEKPDVNDTKGLHDEVVSIIVETF